MVRTRSRSYAVGGSVRICRAGFTLIELLVVVAIIGLLLSIMMPSLGAARQAARKPKCMANLRGIGAAVFMYAADWQQNMPGYQTIGLHAMRMAPGRRATRPSPGHSEPSIFPEGYGLQVVLESGGEPVRMLNGIMTMRDHEKAMYYPADSKGWVCPANPGPMDRPDAKDWGNSYAYRCNSGKKGVVDIDPNLTPYESSQPDQLYNIDFLSRKLEPGAVNAIWKNPVVWDNFNQYPGEPGFKGPFPNYTVDRSLQQPPHHVPSLRAAITDGWIGFYLDGHCQINGINTNRQ
jgi:prepilin-type N-terminal cleavage/methylation domain-containing protein